MKHKFKKFISILLAFIIMLSVLTVAPFTVSAVSAIYGNGTNGIYIDIWSAPYTTYKNKPYGNNAYTTVGCAWFASARAYQITGVDSPIFSGSSWYNGQYANYGYSRGSTIRAKALACYSNHISVVEKVEGNTVTISEGGISDYRYADSGYCAIRTMSVADVQSARGGNFLGYVYLGGGNWYDSLPLANIGDDVYASFLKNDGWVNLCNVNDNVEIDSKSKNSSIIWHFMRQSDGSYVIYNCKNNKVLDVANAGKTAGTNVQVCTYNGSDAQKWYIYGRWSGEYVLRPKLCDKVLDVTGNGNAVGTNVQIWDYNGGNAQKFAIYPAEKAGSSVLSVIAGDSATETKFTWAAASGATLYNLRIKSGVPGNTASYQDIWGVTETSYNIVLPAGYYEVYVDAANFFSYAASNTVKFYVEECDHIHDFSSKESISDDEHQLICSICGYTKTESHNNVNGVCDVCGKSIYYDYIVLDDGTIEITKNKAYKRTEVIIPSSIENKPVTSIGNSSFMTYNSSYVKKVVIPDTVTKIGECAFDYCYELTDITMPNSVTEIGDDAFSTDTSLESITLPNSIKTIGNNAFGSCSCLKNVVIPESVTSIGDRAFAGDDNLTSVTIYSNNASIGEKAFGYIHNSNGNIDKMEGFTITGYKGSTAEVYAKENGFTFIPLDITYNLGDVNDDGEVSIDDVTLIQKYLADVSSFTDTQKTFADVNGDGDVMIDDVTMIQKYLAGIITKLG